MSTDRCETCRHWLRGESRLGLGECRRYPPDYYNIVRSRLRVRVYLQTFGKDWCGEFKEYMYREKTDPPFPRVPTIENEAKRLVEESHRKKGY